MKCVAVDPGKTTGVAVWDNGNFSSFEVPGGLFSAVREVKKQLTLGSVLVFEKFVISKRTLTTDVAEAYCPLYINGAIQVAAIDARCIRIVAQTPAQKEWATDAFLKGIGWYTTGLGGHANDAARHLLKYLTDSRQLPSELLAKLIDLEFN